MYGFRNNIIIGRKRRSNLFSNEDWYDDDYLLQRLLWKRRKPSLLSAAYIPTYAVEQSTSALRDQLNLDLHEEQLHDEGTMADMIVRPRFDQNVQRANVLGSEGKGPIITELSLRTPTVATTPASGSIALSTVATPAVMKQKRLSRIAIESAQNEANTQRLTEAIGKLNREYDLLSDQLLSARAAYTENEERRRVDEAKRRVVEVELQQREDARRDEESAFVAYERCTAIITRLTAQLRDPDIDIEEKDQLSVEREVFKKRKVKAAKWLGLHGCGAN